MERCEKLLYSRRQKETAQTHEALNPADAEYGATSAAPVSTHSLPVASAAKSFTCTSNLTNTSYHHSHCIKTSPHH